MAIWSEYYAWTIGLQLSYVFWSGDVFQGFVCNTNSRWVLWYNWCTGRTRNGTDNKGKTHSYTNVYFNFKHIGAASWSSEQGGAYFFPNHDIMMFWTKAFDVYIKNKFKDTDMIPRELENNRKNRFGMCRNYENTLNWKL